MAQNKEKVVQALVEAICNVSDLVIQANNMAQAYRTKFQNSGATLTGTSLTQAQVNAISTWINSLNALATDQVVTVAQSKKQASHGVEALG